MSISVNEIKGNPRSEFLSSAARIHFDEKIIISSTLPYLHIYIKLKGRNIYHIS